MTAFPKVGENLDKGNILPIGNPWYWDPDQIRGSQASRSRRLLDTLHFLYTLQCEFFDRYTKAVREAGYQGELIGSNWQAGRGYSHFANLHSDYLTGLIDRHNYAAGKANASMLDRAGSGMLSTGMQQVIDRPFMISEWIHCFPARWAWKARRCSAPMRSACKAGTPRSCSRTATRAPSTPSSATRGPSPRRRSWACSRPSPGRSIAAT